jgi:hypothetical protein
MQVVVGKELKFTAVNAFNFGENGAKTGGAAERFEFHLHFWVGVSF